MQFIQKLNTFIEAGFPLIYVYCIDEERLEYVLRRYSNESLNGTLYSWDFESGYNINPNKTNWARQNPLRALEFIDSQTNVGSTIFILKDFHKFMKDVSISRKLKNLSRSISLQGKTIIIVSSEMSIPSELRNFVAFLEFPLPTREELKSELRSVLEFCSPTSGELDYIFDNEEPLKPLISSTFLDTLTQACQGLTFNRIRRVLLRSILKYSGITDETVELILEEKRELIKQTEILEFWPTDQGLDSIGGLEILKDWLRKRSNSFSEQARNYGLDKPRGLLLVGFQGTGKSLISKAIANEWKLPLLRLDVGRLFAGIVGESESRLREMIRVAESLEPCVLWIDELDKAFKYGSGDGGTTNRILSTFLTWLAEKKASVFVVATANNIETLPLEVIRKGRFDEIFFISLPTNEERKQIFKVHLSSFRPDKLETYDLDLLAKETKDFSGAEIRQSIIEAMYTAFQEKRDFTTKDIIKGLDDVVPLARVNPKKVKNLYTWAISGRIRLASYYNKN